MKKALSAVLYEDFNHERVRILRYEVHQFVEQLKLNT